MAGNKRSGRRRLPTAVKTLRGSRVRHARAREPSAARGQPEMPTFLASDALAVDEWGRLAEQALALGVLTVVHGPVLALAASALANLTRMQTTWIETGCKPIVVQSWTDKEGKLRSRVVENPLVRQLRLQQALCANLLGEFGLTPATASKVQTHDGTETDEVELFLRARPTVLAFKKPRARRG
jgi:phage terminase small subunit